MSRKKHIARAREHDQRLRNLGEKPQGAEKHRRALLHELDEVLAQVKFLESVADMNEMHAEQWQKRALDAEHALKRVSKLAQGIDGEWMPYRQIRSRELQSAIEGKPVDGGAWEWGLKA